MLKVLIVDDEAPIRKWLAFCVEQIGSFTVVGTGKNGLQGRLYKMYARSGTKYSKRSTPYRS